MIYLVSTQDRFIGSDFKLITSDESLNIMSFWNRIQLDSETNGKDAHINDFLCVQFGNKKADIQIVVDTTTIDIKLYKGIIENKLIIVQNGKFDFQFLYNYGIIPRRVYDTMIVEQLLHLGYPKGMISYSLKSIAERRLNIDIDKSVRGDIIWRGLDKEVINYSAGDVTYLEDILESQYKDLVKQDMVKAALLENAFVPVIAYLEWCGIKLDETKWKAKMDKDQKDLEESKNALNEFCINNPLLQKFTEVDPQGYLFQEEAFDLTSKCTINWSSSRQVVEVAKILGFDTTVQDKKTGEDKDSVLEKHLKCQKGINDEFIKLYFNYQEKAKVCSTYGKGHLNTINPNTGRCHTIYRQLGCDSGKRNYLYVCIYN